MFIWQVLSSGMQFIYAIDFYRGGGSFVMIYLSVSIYTSDFMYQCRNIVIHLLLFIHNYIWIAIIWHIHIYEHGDKKSNLQLKTHHISVICKLVLEWEQKHLFIWVFYPHSFYVNVYSFCFCCYCSCYYCCCPCVIIYTKQQQQHDIIGRTRTATQSSKKLIWCTCMQGIYAR